MHQINAPLLEKTTTKDHGEKKKNSRNNCVIMGFFQLENNEPV
jgi:hypothetical protein